MQRIPILILIILQILIHETPCPFCLRTIHRIPSIQLSAKEAVMECVV